MSKRELAKAYNPHEVEDKWYEYWMKNGYFYAKVNPEKKTLYNCNASTKYNRNVNSWTCFK